MSYAPGRLDGGRTEIAVQSQALLLLVRRERGIDHDPSPSPLHSLVLKRLVNSMPARTRACSTCRTMRIRCDCTLPHCRMCSRLGKICPGPLQGPLIVDMTAKAKHGTKKRRSINKQRTLAQLQSDTVQYMQVNCVSQTPIQALVIQAFYANFLAQFAVGERQDIQNELTWLQRLPGLATDRSNQALVLALEATATVYGAIMSSQNALDKHARELYGTALHVHHGLLQKSRSKDNITIHMVSTSVLLSFFEAMQATTADGYCVHIYGAARLLDITGPGECGQGVLCQLFYHVRTQMLFVQLATDYRSAPISAKRILYKTLQYQHPPLIQRLMCCIAALAELGSVMYPADIALLTNQVDQLWNEYSKSNTLCMYSLPMESVQFDNPFMAITMTFFSAAYILLAEHGPGSTDQIDAVHHFQLILDAAMYIDTDNNAIAFMRMSTPLLLVALHGCHHGLRTGAITRYQVWSTKCMSGISALALNAVRRKEQRAIDMECYNEVTTS